jgi:hypothetical protein
LNLSRHAWSTGETAQSIQHCNQQRQHRLPDSLWFVHGCIRQIADDLDLVTARCTSQRRTRLTCLQTKLCCELSSYPSREEASQLSDTICRFVTTARALRFFAFRQVLVNLKAKFGPQKLTESVPVIARGPYYPRYYKNSKGGGKKKVKTKIPLWLTLNNERRKKVKTKIPLWLTLNIERRKNKS